MAKRILLFLAANLAIVAMVSLAVMILGSVGLAIGPARLPLVPVAIICAVWGLLGSLLSLLLCRGIVKRALGVRVVDGQTGDNDLDWLHETTQALAQQARIRMPEIGVYDSAEVNAFATGRSRRRSLVAISTGLLRNMSRDEVEGVVAHEIAHIANGDMVTMALLQGVLNAFVLSFAHLAVRAVARAGNRLSQAVGVVVRVVLELALGLLGAAVVVWFSRRREFRADAEGAALTGRPKMLAALRQLQRTVDRIDGSRPALAAFKIAGVETWFDVLRTHPPIEQRIAVLERASL